MIKNKEMNKNKNNMKLIMRDSYNETFPKYLTIFIFIALFLPKSFLHLETFKLVLKTNKNK